MVTDAAATPEPSALLAVQRAAHASVQAVTAELATLGLGGSELNALANLAGDRGRTVSELAAAAGVRPTTLTSVLDRLERNGYITRGRRPGDRRAVVIELTAAGRHATNAITAAIASLERRALANLSSRDIAAFRAVLNALTEVTPHEYA